MFLITATYADGTGTHTITVHDRAAAVTRGNLMAKMAHYSKVVMHGGSPNRELARFKG